MTQGISMVFGIYTGATTSHHAYGIKFKAPAFTAHRSRCPDVAAKAPVKGDLSNSLSLEMI